MKIKHHDIQIPEDNPFANCKLEREPYARVLTDIVNTYADGFVFAINNEWGAGKTTFVKMWQQQLKNEGFQTIYFNAWENDFDNNPLVAIMSELQTLTNTNNEKVFKSVVEKGAVLVKNIAPALAKSLIKKYVVDIDDIAIDAIENATKASTEILEEEIKEYTSKKRTIVEFRNELETFVKQTENKKPLIFIVDELDRCRPNYSVEVLEQIKHFFSVSGIVFVLSIDKKHLGGAIKGFYGSEQINTNEYLRRFIDLEYSIPFPQTNLFVDYLYEYYNFNDFFYSVERSKINEFKEDSKLLKLISNVLFTKTNSTLRQQEKVFALSRLVLSSFKSNEYTFPHLLFILVYFKTMKNEDYLKIENNSFSIQELSNLFFDSIYSINKDKQNLNLLFIEALLLWFYNNNSNFQYKTKLLEREESGNFITPIKSKLENFYPDTSLVKWFEIIDKQYDYREISLIFLIQRINLTESVTIH